MLTQVGGFHEGLMSLPYHDTEPVSVIKPASNPPIFGIKHATKICNAVLTQPILILWLPFYNWNIPKIITPQVRIFILSKWNLSLMTHSSSYWSGESSRYDNFSELVMIKQYLCLFFGGAKFWQNIIEFFLECALTRVGKENFSSVDYEYWML